MATEHDDTEALQELTQARIAIAETLIQLAEIVTGRQHGVTVVVHDNLGESRGVVALTSSLPGRSAVRGMLASVLLESLRRDGILDDDTLGMIPAHVEADLMAWLNRGKPSA